MESANQPPDFSQPFDSEQRQLPLHADIRRNTRDEQQQVTDFVQDALYTHIHADWYNWRYWITDNQCWLSHEKQKNKEGEQLSGVLAIATDVPTVAWLRLIALHRVPFSHARLRQHAKAMLMTHLAHLQDDHLEMILWMSDKEWVRRWADALNFTPYRDIITFTKDDVEIPPHFVANPDVRIRPAVPEDMRQLAKIEADTYEPMWQNTASTLIRAYNQCFSFQVAHYDGQLVGFQISTQNERNGIHLARITVAPSTQGQGVGRTLLMHALQDYAKKGCDHVTLNTQESNGRAQHLYRQFGFSPTGHKATIWRYDLHQNQENKS